MVGALCVALVAWMDWSVRRLADWRLDSFGARQAQDFLGAQVVVMAPLLLFPAPQTCLVAFIAMRVARVMRWPAIDDLRYVAAR